MEASATDDGRARAVRILERCFEAIAAQDADRLVEHYTEDYVLEFPYRTPEKPLVIEGREAARAHLARALAGVRMQLSIESARWIEPEQLLIAEYTSRGEFVEPKAPYANRYVGFWHFEGERIRRTREYYNPEARRSTPPA
jgi:ketosteroid isomerase-like protein